MTNMELELLMQNLKGANLAQTAKDDLNKMFEEVKNTSMEAFLSEDKNVKDAVIISQMALIGKLVSQEITLIDHNQKITMDISGIISSAARKIEDDSDNQEGDNQ